VSTSWFLESVSADGSPLILAIRTLPFRVGRDPAAELWINTRGLSRQHAELRAGDHGTLCLHDLDSTNGTWVNRERVQGVRVLAEDDLIHFGNAAYRLGRAPQAEMAAQDSLLQGLPRGEGLAATAQPIVQAQGGALHGHELRGRGSLLALVEAFRQPGGARFAPPLHGGWLFLDTQPEELFSEGFFAALKSLRALPTPPSLVVQVPETAALQVRRLQTLAARLAPLGVRLAHAGFGADRAHLDVLGEVQAHYVQFASRLVRGLHEAPAARQKQLRDLVKLVLDLDAVPLAAGVTLEAEAALCRDMGFQLLQGELIGAPQPLALPQGPAPADGVAADPGP